MENFYHNLMLNIANCFVTSENGQEELKNFRSMASLIRIHNKNFAQAGEASFPCDPNLWEIYFPVTKGLRITKEAFDLNEEGNENGKRFLAEARNWFFPVSRLDVRNERCHLYLQRRNVMGNLIQQVLSDPNYGSLKKTENINVYVKPVQANGLDNQNLSLHRVKLVHQTLEKLLPRSRYNVVNEQASSALTIDVVSVASTTANDDVQQSDVKLKCGPVIYPLTKGEICELTTDEYFKYVLFV